MSVVVRAPVGAFMHSKRRFESPGLSMHPKAAQPRDIAMEMNGSKPREGQVKAYYWGEAAQGLQQWKERKRAKRGDSTGCF